MKAIVVERFSLLIAVIVAAALQLGSAHAAGPAVVVLVYHRLGPVRSDSMTVTTEHFKQQLKLLCENHYSVIPLARLVAWRLGKTPAPPARSVVLTFDDGHESVYQYARAVIAENRLPVTLFIYPSCISNASYALTWDQLSELTSTPLFAVESHTYWHPNFKQESKKLDEGAYKKFVDVQLRRSRDVLEERLHRPIDLLAWPFGIYDPFLISRATAAGYQAAFTIDCRAATMADPVMALPRCLVSDEYVGSRFLRFIDSAIRSAHH